jgi:hypothetical protein
MSLLFNSRYSLQKSCWRKLIKKLINIFFVVVAVAFHLTCDRNDQKRKIKLSDQAGTQNFTQKLTTTIRLEPKERRAIAVMFFQNLTGDQNLEWLKKGLTEMLIRTLSQSSHLSILSTDRLVEIIDRHAATKTSQDIDLDMAAFCGQGSQCRSCFSGTNQKKRRQLKHQCQIAGT